MDVGFFLLMKVSSKVFRVYLLKSVLCSDLVAVVYILDLKCEQFRLKF